MKIGYIFFRILCKFVISIYFLLLLSVWFLQFSRKLIANSAQQAKTGIRPIGKFVHLWLKFAQFILNGYLTFYIRKVSEDLVLALLLTLERGVTQLFPSLITSSKLNINFSSCDISAKTFVKAFAYDEIEALHTF